MSKTKTFYQCQACVYASPKWLGKCPDCGSWNSFVEEKEVSLRQKGLFIQPSTRASDSLLLVNLKSLDYKLIEPVIC
jgi:DNA repair protein RadA/Sms